MTLLEVAAKNAWRNKFRTTHDRPRRGGGRPRVRAPAHGHRRVDQGGRLRRQGSARDAPQGHHRHPAAEALHRRRPEQRPGHQDGLVHGTGPARSGRRTPNVFFAEHGGGREHLPRLPRDRRSTPRPSSGGTRDKQGAIVGATLARKLGWKVGDKVTLAGTIYPGRLAIQHRRHLQRAAADGHGPVELLLPLDVLERRLERTAEGQDWLDRQRGSTTRRRARRSARPSTSCSTTRTTRRRR